MSEPSSRNLVFETVESLRLVVSCQSDEAPSDAEWDAWLAAVRKLHGAVHEFRLLVLTEGGRPTRDQQRRLQETKRATDRAMGTPRSEPRTALVSPAAGDRFVVSVLVFMNPAIRCFSPARLDDAYAHLGLAGPERASADAAIARLRPQLAKP